MQITGTFCVIPVEVDATENGSIPPVNNGDFIMFLKGFDEMFAVEATNDFGSEIIDDETEEYGTGEMLE